MRSTNLYMTLVEWFHIVRWKIDRFLYPRGKGEND